jgi:hypothetical protein
MRRGGATLATAARNALLSEKVWLCGLFAQAVPRQALSAVAGSFGNSRRDQARRVTTGGGKQAKKPEGRG